MPDADDQPRLGVCLGGCDRAQCVKMSCLIQVVHVDPLPVDQGVRTAAHRLMTGAVQHLC